MGSGFMVQYQSYNSALVGFECNPKNWYCRMEQPSRVATRSLDQKNTISKRQRTNSATDSATLKSISDADLPIGKLIRNYRKNTSKLVDIPKNDKKVKKRATSKPNRKGKPLKVAQPRSEDASNQEPPLRKLVKLDTTVKQDSFLFSKAGSPANMSDGQLDETTDNIPQSLTGKQQEIWKDIDREWFSVLPSSNPLLSLIKVAHEPLQRDEIQQEIGHQLRQLQKHIQNQRTSRLMSLPMLLKEYEPVADNRNREEEAQRIMDTLQFNRIIRSFSKGFADKIQEEVFFRFEVANILQRKYFQPKDKDSKAKKVDTECKICFNCQSESEPCSTIVYCDKCGTSFHQACYGLNKIPSESTPYYCDVCQQFQSLPRKPIVPCRICKKQNFPMRKLENHYYHVTCLFLNNLITFRQGQLQLRSSVNTSSIEKLVEKAQEDLRVDNGFCEFCVNSCEMRGGLQVQCSHSSCSKWFHPICAFLNGCEFSLSVRQNKKKRKELSLVVHCKYMHQLFSDHDIDRDYKLQTYLRRYSLNLSGAFNQSYPQFLKVHDRSETKRLKEVNRIRAVHIKRAPIKEEEGTAEMSDDDDKTAIKLSL